jgi:hypothetical protein
MPESRQPTPPPKTQEELRIERDAIQKAHNDRIQLIITITSTFVAIVAALAAVWSGWEAHETRENDERPFVEVDTGSGMDSVYLRSSGKSPAFRIQAVCIKDPNERSVSWGRALNPSTPDFAYRFMYLLPAHSEQLPCTMGPSPLRGVKVYGLIKYEDQDKNHYQTPFCYTLIPNAVASSGVSTCPGTEGFPELK